MLQITGNTRQERFLNAVKSLNLRFPVRQITDKTGYGKSTVSAYLKDREASEEFIRKFCEVFKIDFDLIWNGCPPSDHNNFTNGIDLKDKLISNQEREINSLKDQIADLKKQLDVNLKRMVLYEQVNAARLKTIVECQKLLRSKALKEPFEDAKNQVDTQYLDILREIQDAEKF